MTAPLAIVLAAGEGRRMGGPKALLLVDGQPLVQSHVQRLIEAGCRPVIVVVGTPLAPSVRELLHALPEARVCGADTTSMAASLAVALGYAAPRPERSVVVVPVDTLPVSLATLSALLRALTSPEVQVATPRYQGRGGHPIVARETALQTFREGYPGTLRDLLQSSEEQRRRVDVDDPEVTSGLDTPADLAARRPGSKPRFAGATD